MEPHDDFIPPPPYSRTDIYSQAGHPNNNSDNASVTPSSTNGNVIYTPPETPQESHYNFAATNGSNRNSLDDYQASSASSSAQAYFESRRPVHSNRRIAGSTVVHSITVSPQYSSDVLSDFPYPEWAPRRDVSEQDWHTFINYLIPDHAELANAVAIDRKLHAEEKEEKREGKSDVAGQKVPAEAQPEQIVKSPTGADVQRTQQGLDDTVREWNAGFFAPRGVTIRLNPFPSKHNSNSSNGNAPTPTADSTAAGGGQRDLPERGGFAGLRGLFNGPDGQGFRLGPLFGGAPSPLGGEGPTADRDRGPGGRGRRRHRDRGRRAGRHRAPSSDSSTSSSSSSSSSSSNDPSLSSLGSLPDWDDLRDAQIPVVRQSITAWLEHPDQPVTRAEFKYAKAQIKAAKNNPPPPPSKATAQQRQEVKKLMASWDKLKRSQRERHRQARRERKSERRSLRRERKTARRAEKRERRRARKEMQRGGGGQDRGATGLPDVVSAVMGRIQQGIQQGMPTPPPPPPSQPPLGVRAGNFPPTGPVPPAGLANPGRSNGPGFWGGRATFSGFGGRGNRGGRGGIFLGSSRSGRGFGFGRGAPMFEVLEVFDSRDPIPPPPAPPLRNPRPLRAGPESLPLGRSMLPGAWPSGDLNELVNGTAHDQNQDHDHHDSEKYRAVTRLESELAAHNVVLQSLRTSVAANGPEGAASGKLRREVEVVEARIEALGRDVERIRFEADEEFARELEEEERKGGTG